MANDITISFQRSPHNKENPYAMISRDLIRDGSLSPECRMIIIYLLSMRDDFKIKSDHLWKHFKEFIGRDRILRFIEEACEAGYMKREKNIVKNLVRGYTYYVSESPLEEYKQDFKKSFRCPEPQGTELRGPEDQGTLRKTSKEERLLREEKKERGAAPQSPSAPPPSFFLKDRVKMDQRKYDKLIEDFGEPKVSEYIEKLDQFADINPKRFKQYACHGAVIRKWITDDVKKISPKSQKSIDSSQDFSGYIPYDEEIALMRKNQGEQEYISYLKCLTDKKYYQEYLKSKEKE